MISFIAYERFRSSRRLFGSNFCARWWSWLFSVCACRFLRSSVVQALLVGRPRGNKSGSAHMSRFMLTHNLTSQNASSATWILATAMNTQVEFWRNRATTHKTPAPSTNLDHTATKWQRCKRRTLVFQFYLAAGQVVFVQFIAVNLL